MIAYIFVRKIKGKRRLGRPRKRWENKPKLQVKRKKHYRLEMPPEFCHFQLQLWDLSEENHTNF